MMTIGGVLVMRRIAVPRSVVPTTIVHLVVLLAVVVARLTAFST